MSILKLWKEYRKTTPTITVFICTTRITKMNVLFLKCSVVRKLKLKLKIKICSSQICANFDALLRKVVQLFD